MISTLNVAEDDLVEIKMIFNQTGYKNLLKGNLPILNIDPITSKDLSEKSFTQKVINRITKNHGGYQQRTK